MNQVSLRASLLPHIFSPNPCLPTMEMLDNSLLDSVQTLCVLEDSKQYLTKAKKLFFVSEISGHNIDIKPVFKKHLLISYSMFFHKEVH